MDKSITRDIIDFLNVVSVPQECDQECECGSRMEYRMAAISFEEKTWSVPLAFCPVCNPAVPRLAS
jgi:hypothetical protein